jgi:GNAT superfamily N-acetyltransferase
MHIRKINPEDIPWVKATVSEYFGSPRVVSRGVLHDSAGLPGFIAEDEPGCIGLLQFRINNDECEIINLISLKRRQGVGTRLLKAVEDMAAEAGCKRLWLITTNNNVGALEFYRTAGWKQVAVHKGAITESRKLKPEIPSHDERGVPIEDEIEFERILNGG